MNFTKHEFFKAYDAQIYSALKAKMITESEKRDGLLNPYKLIEDLRWDSSFKIIHQREFKIPNAHRAYYLRLLIHQVPQFKARVKLCKSGADEMTEREIALLIMGKNPDNEPKEIKTLTLFNI